MLAGVAVIAFAAVLAALLLHGGDGEDPGDGTLPAAFEDPADRRVAAAGDRVVSFAGRRATGAEGYTVPDGG
ncbi:hypothetical protein ABGB09_04940 [Streptomyces sp. B8F3]|uniref:hypothetical protein n=1 Tax=Streptomyces sp. B8F3 TaxID=3153573 RepID=UPI00325D6849